VTAPGYRFRLARALEWLRLRARLTDADMAAACDVLPREVARWQQGATVPQPEAIDAWLEACGCEVDDLAELLVEAPIPPRWLEDDAIGVALGEIRARGSLSQYELARRIGIARRSVERIERLQRRPAALVFAAWLAACGAGIDEFGEIVNQQQGG
jgi:transcriptional regulator with XRE-family HTH domain